MSAEKPDISQLLMVARVCVREGRFSDAWDALVRARQLAPEDAEILERMTNVAVRLGAIATARDCVEALVSLRPRDPASQVRRGIICFLQGRLRDAEKAYRTALEIDETLPQALSGLGRIALARGQAESAEAFFERALQSDSEHMDATVGLALLCENKGHPQRALDLLAPWTRSGLATVEVARIFAGASRQLRIPEPAVALINMLLQRSPVPAERAALLFSLAGLYESLGRHDDAFLAAAEGNRLIGGKFDPDEFKRRIDRSIGVGRLHPIRGHAIADTPMVFIVGVPRSGTTLVEQILAQHPAVLAAGEHSRIEDMALRLEENEGCHWEEALGSRTETQLAAMAARYLAPLGRIPADTQVVTDKMPINFLFLGLIARVFPMARVIWCSRDPLDVGVSCYLQSFGGRGVEFANDLAHIGFYIRESNRLMAHWRQVLDLPIKHVQYENLVRDPTAEVSRLLDFLCIPWDDRCLLFHESGRFVDTPSYAQVRRPISQQAVGRHEPYRKFLGPLMAALRGSSDTD